MKVVIDPIYSTKPSHCASALKARRLVEYVLSQTDDVFFRWLIPDWEMEAEEYEWFPEHPNIEYLKYPYSHDRMREYQVFPKELETLLAFNGPYWDTDVVITMRTQQIQNMKLVMTSPRNYNQAFLKKVLLWEEMPVMSFKKTVAVSDRRVQDLATLCGYVAADDVLITIKHEKTGVMEAAKRFMSPAIVKELRDKIRLYTPVDVKAFGFHSKAEDRRFVRGQRPFCLGFTERMGLSTTNLETIYSVMEKHWILKGDLGFKVVFSTVSTGIKMAPPEFCQVLHPPREEFWRLLREEMDLVITMTTEGGFGMSQVEPLLLGVPSVMKRATWLESLFGEDYPFFVHNETEAYAMIKMFHDDYPGMYARFLDWQQGAFKAMFDHGGQYEHTMYELFYARLQEFKTKTLPQYIQEFPGKADNDVVQAVCKATESRSEMVLHDVLGELAEQGVFRGLSSKLEDTRDSKGIVWATPWNEFRMALMAFHGWEDASVKAGHMRRVK